MNICREEFGVVFLGILARFLADCVKWCADGRGCDDEFLGIYEFLSYFETVGLDSMSLGDER